jgi:hypothetical protein
MVVVYILRKLLSKIKVVVEATDTETEAACHWVKWFGQKRIVGMILECLQKEFQPGASPDSAALKLWEEAAYVLLYTLFEN